MKKLLDTPKVKKKRSVSLEVQAKGRAALAEYRKEQAKAKAKGDKAYQEWLDEQALRKAQKKLSPMQAIKAFCNNCVGDIKADITNCTAKKCPLYIYRPYQKGEDE